MLFLLTSLRESSASSLYNSKILVENTTVYKAEKFNAEVLELSWIYNESIYYVTRYISSDIVIRISEQNALLKLYITFIYICFQLDNAETKLVRRFGPWRYASTACKQQTLEWICLKRNVIMLKISAICLMRLTAFLLCLTILMICASKV